MLSALEKEQKDENQTIQSTIFKLTIIGSDRWIVDSDPKIIIRVTSGCSIRKQFDNLFNGNKFFDVRMRPIKPEINQ